MTNLTIAPDSQGKVRDIYDLGDRLLLVASDRISAFDYVLEDPIPYKGEILTRISLFWFEYLRGIVPTHILTADVDTLPDTFAAQRDYLRGRSMIVKKATVFPVECIVRGYLAGSGLKEYNATGKLCGIDLPAGLVNSSRFETPLFTPSTKAEQGDHDENIDFDAAVAILGEETAHKLREYSLAVYEAGRARAAERGIIIADTKFEFGQIDGEITLIDEVLTPDSSRFWPADRYREGQSQESFDKQFVRDWLETTSWDKSSTPPRLPREVIETTSAKYIQAYEIITGEKFVPLGEV